MLSFWKSLFNILAIMRLPADFVFISSSSGHVSFRHGLASVVRPLAFHVLIFSFENTGPIWTKLGRDGPWVVPFQNYFGELHPPSGGATKGSKEKNQLNI